MKRGKAPAAKGLKRRALAQQEAVGVGECVDEGDAQRGVLFLVVGPSGVGKDTLIDHAHAILGGDPAFEFAQRVITRPRDAGGEDHDPMSEEDFGNAVRAGAFMATWGAHGLRYGIRSSILNQLRAGQNVVVNGSRGQVSTFRVAWPRLVVLWVTAPPDVVERRLKARGREDAHQVAERLARAVPVARAKDTIEIVNDGTVADGGAQFLSAILGAAHLPLTVVRAPFDEDGICLVHAEARVIAARQLGGTRAVDVVAGGRAVRARLLLVREDKVLGRQSIALTDGLAARLGVLPGMAVTVRRARAPTSRDVLRKKVAGGELSALELERVVRDILDGRYDEGAVAGFLVAAAQNLSLDEVIALTRVRAALGTPLRFDAPIVADKHSMGGVPGSRITLIVVPIAAAHGLLVPKTSSRAITSAAGTADVMECAARVDLSRAELFHAVATAGAAIAWNGKISHSPLDDVMNVINRPLRIRSARLDVSSILSKKLLAGATHVIIDIPAGPGAKLETAADGARLAGLFEAVGQGVGLHVEARVTDASEPVGRAVGPTLELRDVEAVLTGAADACPGLRAKALDFAGRMLEWDCSVVQGTGRGRAEALLASGAAAAAFARIVNAQGALPRAAPGLFSRIIRTPNAGTLTRIHGDRLAGLARAAGAPHDKGAGGRLLVEIGAVVPQGAGLLEVVASTQEGIERTAGYGTEGLFEIG